jgi:hypothetical protein
MITPMQERGLKNFFVTKSIGLLLMERLECRLYQCYNLIGYTSNNVWG